MNPRQLPYAPFGETCVEDISTALDLDEWLIPCVLPKGFTLLCAPSRTGKTFVALACCLAMSDGLPVGGALPATGTHTLDDEGNVRPVIYYGREDSPSGIKRRTNLLRRPRNDLSIDNLFVAMDATKLNLDTPEGQRDLTQVVVENNPSLMVFDTARRFFTGEENDSTAVSIITTFLRNLTMELNTNVLLVHHVTKEGGRPRGSGVWQDSSDADLYAEQYRKDGYCFAIKVTGNSRNVAAPIPWSLGITQAKPEMAHVMFESDDLESIQAVRANMGLKPLRHIRFDFCECANQILGILQGGGSMSMGQLKEQLQSNSQRINRGLKELQLAALVEVWQEGRVRKVRRREEA